MNSMNELLHNDVVKPLSKSYFSKSLIIIGNGFDLSLGLASKFSEFLNVYKDSEDSLKSSIKDCKQYFINNINKNFSFNKISHPIYKKIRGWKLYSNESEIADYCYNHFIDNVSGINFWAVYLYLKKKEDVEDWASIEDQMYKLLSFDNIDLLRICYRIYNFYPSDNLNRYTCNLRNKKINLGKLISGLKANAIRIEESIESLSSNDIDKLVFSILMIIIMNPKYKTKIMAIKSTSFESVENIVFNFLKDQEYKFEESLNDYISSKVTKYKTITGKSYTFIGKQLLKVLSNGKTFSLFNFNYTNPLNSNKDPLSENKNKKGIFAKALRRNIHGVLTKDKSNSQKLIYHRTSPIIGISDKYLDINDPAYKFTKNYRILRLSCNDYSDIFKPTIHRICFFGQSFDSADYSYFRDIFDSYRVSSGSVKLIFYYICHDGETDDDGAIGQMNKIVSLFQDYCGNSKNAKELIHTLSLKGDIEITNLYDNVDKTSDLGKQLKYINKL